MSAREQLPIRSFAAIAIAQQLDDRAVRVLTDGHQHSASTIKWALDRNPYMASFTTRELALGSYEVHRT